MNIIVSKHEGAYCVNCGSDDPASGGWNILTGNEVGEGKYSQTCVKCGEDTLYDLESEIDHHAD